MIRKALLALLASVAIANGAQAVTYAQYKIDVFGNASTVDVNFNIIEQYGFIRTYTFNFASTDVSPLFQFPLLVGFTPNSVGTFSIGAFFNNNLEVSSDLPSVDGLPDIRTGHITSSKFEYGATKTGGSGIYTFFSGTAKFATTQFSSTSFGDSGVTETVQTSAAPEPAAWAMMVAGFGAVGLAMRSRRRARVAFA